MIIFSHAKTAESAKFYSLLCFTLRWSGRKLRYDKVRRVVSSKFSSSSSYHF